MASAMEKICRTCMCSNQKLFPIFDEKHEEQQEANVNIAMMLTEFTKYKVDSLDDLPQSICSACKSTVQSSYAFKRKCEETYLKLLDILDARSQASPNNIKKEAMYYEEDEMEIPKALQNVSFSITENKGDSETEEPISNTDGDGDKEDKKQQEIEFLQVFVNETDADLKKSDNVRDRDDSTDDDNTSYDTLGMDTFNKSTFNSVERKHKTRVVQLLKCDDCDTLFRRPGLLKKHQINRHGEKSHICELCKMGFRTIHRLKQHVVTHSKKHFKCKGCSASYFTQAERDAHVKAEKHDKTKLCPECGLRCKTNGDLKVHMRRHTGEKPCICYYCKKGFASAQEMRVHERCHTGEKSHFCKECGKGFQKKFYLDKHSLVHHGSKEIHICSNCKQKFIQLSDLEAHICCHITEGHPNNISLLQNIDSFFG